MTEKKYLNLAYQTTHSTLLFNRFLEVSRLFCDKQVKPLNRQHIVMIYNCVTQSSNYRE
jgi:hypothetical protein